MAFGTDYTPVGPMPADIVLGYVDATSMRLAGDIRDKGHGIDTRETMARMILKSSTMHNHLIKVNNSLKVQNDEYYRQFSDVLKELSEDKDYHSLPEIAGARRGYQTLIESLNNLSFNMFNTNLGKVTPNMVSDELLAQIAGDTAVNAVPADGSLTTPKYSDGSVTQEKTDFIKVGTNKYNYKTVTDDMYLSSAGTLLSGSGFYVSDFISVLGQSQIAFGKARHYAFYNQDKGFVSGNNTLSEYYGIVVDVPTEAYYVRFSFNGEEWVTKNQLNFGSTLLEFEPFTLKIPDFSLDINFELQDIQGVIPTRNLFNKENVFINQYVNWANGFLSSNVAYVATDFIRVEPNQLYSFTNIKHYAWYDAQRNFIGGSNDDTTHSETSPSNARYVRLSIQKVNTEIAQFEQGSPTEYVSFGYTINNLIIEEKEEYPYLDTLNLPKDLYALIGEELNIYFDNIMSERDTDYTFDVICSEGDQYENFYRLVPETSGDVQITINANREGIRVAQEKATIHKVDKSVGSGATKTLTIIGDSTTNNGAVIEKLLENFETDVMSVEMVGTRGASPALHEGRSGWKAENYVSNEAISGVVNSFWNPSTSSFDFNYWMMGNGFSAPDYVLINLGINDMFNEYSDESLEAKITETIGYYEQIVASIKSTSSDIKIGIAITIPPNYSQDGFAKPYGSMQTHERYKRNNILWVESLMEAYQNKEAENIYLIPIHTNLDTRYNMGLQEEQVNKRNPMTANMPVKNGGVHPSVSGYWQIADVYWFWLKSFES